MKAQVNYFSSTEQFKIDISGIEFIFLSDKLLNKSEGILYKIHNFIIKYISTFCGLYYNH